MTRWSHLRSAALVASALLAACSDRGVGGFPGYSPVCTAPLQAEGFFVSSGTRPTNHRGCWPLGTWTFKTTVVKELNECAQLGKTPRGPNLPSEDSFSVEVSDTQVIDREGRVWGEYPRALESITVIRPERVILVDAQSDGSCLAQILDSRSMNIDDLEPAAPYKDAHISLALSQSGTVINGEGRWSLFEIPRSVVDRDERQ